MPLEAKLSRRSSTGRAPTVIAFALLAFLVCAALASCGKTAQKKAKAYPVAAVAVQAQPELGMRLAGSDGWLAAATGTSIAEGDSVWTESGSSTFVLLKDGARLSVAEGTSLKLALLKGEVRVELSRGEVSLDRVGDAGPSVGTPAAAVIASGGASDGASFVVKVDPGGKTTVAVASGSAKLKNGAGKTTVPADSVAVCEPGRPPAGLPGTSGTQAIAPPPVQFPSLVYLQVVPYFRNEATRDAAEDDARANLNATPDDAWSHLNLARALVDANKLPEARAQFEDALTSNPQFSQAFEGLGKVDLLEGKWKDAADAYANAQRADRESFDAVFGMGQAALGQGDLREAEKWYKETLKLAPGGTNPLVGLGIVQLLRQDFDTALDDLRGAVQDDPSNTRAYPVMAIIYSMRGDLDAAEQNLKKALEVSSSDAAALESLGIVYMRQGKLDAASAAFKSLVDDDDPVVVATGYQDQGAVEQIGGSNQSTLDKWVKAHDLAPGRQPLLIDLGEAHQSLNDYDAAVAAFSQAASADQYYWYPHEWLSRACLAKKAYAEAVTESRVAIALDPAAWISHLVLGLALDQTGASGEARSQLQTGRELKPSGRLSASERVLLGMSFGVEKDYNHAQEIVRKDSG